MDRTTKVTFPGCILKPLARGQFHLQHSARASLYTELDAKGLEFLLYFAEPSSLEEAVAHFRALGWDLPDSDFEAAFEQMTAGFLLVPAQAAAAPARAGAPAPAETSTDLTIGEADEGDVAGVVALRNQLFTNLERTLQPEDAPAPIRGELFARVPELSAEGRALLYVLLRRALLATRGESEQGPLERALDGVHASLVPMATLLGELRERGFLDAAEGLTVPADEQFPIFALLREELFAGEGERADWRPTQAQAQAVHLVARREGAVAGYLRGLILSYDAVCDEAVLQEMVVGEGERGRGTGSQLVAAYQRLCQEKGVASVRVPTQRTNLGAIRFYERAGFKAVNEDCYLWWSPRSGEGR